MEIINKIKNSFRTKLLISFLIPLLCIVIFVMVYFPGKQRSSSLNSATDQVSSLTEMLSFAVGAGLSDGNFDLVQTAFDWAKKNSNVMYIGIYDESQKPLIEHNPNKITIDYPILIKNANQPAQLDHEYVKYCNIIKYKDKDYGHIISFYSLKEVNAKINTDLYIAIIICAVLLFGGIVMLIIVTKIISKHIEELKTAAQQISNGDLNVEIKVGVKDEIGELARSFKQMSENIKKLVVEFYEKTNTIASSSDSLEELSHSIESSTKELASRTALATNSSEEVSANVSTVTASAEEMIASIKEISKNTTYASQLSQESMKSANEASEVMNRLGASSSEIGNIIKVINSIAEQTNLLALNATIEAARAGESGKGFAVVANEVKELAKGSAKATEDISDKIKMIQQDSQNAISVIKIVIENINKINDISNVIASAVEEQTVTTHEVNRNLIEAGIGVSSIVDSNTGIANEVNGFSNIVNVLKNSSIELKEMSSGLKNDITSNYKF